MGQLPKRSITKLKLKEGYFGPRQRIENAKEAFDNNLVFPKPVEYSDIDKAVLEFVDKEIKLTADGKAAPTFTLFSNQRFSEYSQTWQHTDEDGNLLMDFKTVNRESNPSWGSNQGGLYNIPGDRRYTVQMKEVLDDNGTESYEVYSMGQPLSIDLIYTVNYVTADWDNLNNFNLQINDLFKSIQCYIKPNGWYMPVKLEELEDSTEYSVDNRKIYIQSALLKVCGIISPKSTYKIEKFPKRKFINGKFEENIAKSYVDIEELPDETTRITVYFPSETNKCEFTFDETMHIVRIEMDNIRDFSININDDRIEQARNGFSLNNGDVVKIKINQIEKKLPSKIIFFSD